MIDLMMYVIMPAGVLLAASFFFTYHLRTKEQLRKQDEIAKRITDIKAAYKATLEMFVMQRIIRPAHIENYFAIIDNYFVNQEITEENARKMEKLANRIAVTITKQVNLSNSKGDTEWLKKKLLNVALMLPNRTREYNTLFYQTRLKELLQGLAATKSSFIQRHAKAA